MWKYCFSHHHLSCKRVWVGKGGKSTCIYIVHERWCLYVYIKCDFNSKENCWGKISSVQSMKKKNKKKIIWIIMCIPERGEEQEDIAYVKYVDMKILMRKNCDRKWVWVRECRCERERVCVRVQTIKDVSWFVTNDHETTSLDLLLHFFPTSHNNNNNSNCSCSSKNNTKFCSLQVHQSKSVLNQVNITIKTIAS